MQATGYRATVEYDGSNYYGFQRQIPEQPTIQGELEKALETIAGKPVVVHGAGRTDSGVHACGQVISFDLSWSHGLAALQRAINANLPADIVLLDIGEAAADFHPRFDARRRAYCYYVYNAPVRSPLRRFRSWHLSQPLDVAAMNAAAAVLVGEYDFATFGQPPQGENTIRIVHSAEWRREDEMVVFSIEGTAFLQRMVRSIVGSLRLVGDGRWTVADFVDAFRACDRDRAGQTAPPDGLYLTAVIYDEEHR
ncbi:MAG: tRNA pseudouridine(38-40) synthase TruA [Anaerolineae bacterium]|nr:tRNA pseudouridine(38-40) synthase TruA [Anaerolineae bacterium]